jgi:hypothetical protein
MLFPMLFRHWKWNSRRDREGRSRRRRVPPRRLLRLETLEDRTVLSTLTVTSAADDGSAGTLRSIFGSAQNGDTIHFAKTLEGQTIALTQGQLVIDQSLTIDGLGMDKLAIGGNRASRIFDIGSGATVTISDLTITGGRATDGAGILNAGNLTLSNDVLSFNVAQVSRTRRGRPWPYRKVSSLAMKPWAAPAAATPSAEASTTRPGR